MTRLDKKWASASHWVKRAVAIACCLTLVVALGVVFTRVIAARVPEQRATLEKLITQRTGLEVRFDDVHFAWNLDGTSAVFTRVELTDPKAGRVRVAAPELRVEFDAWDFLRHQRFSLGHVTLSSPDIEVIRDPESTRMATARDAGPRADAAAHSDEAALIHRYLGWANLMPTGRIEVEGARVRVLDRGDRLVRHSFTLSQAVVSRGSSNFSAYGTLLLAQDLGQSLFVSIKLDGLGPETRLSGDLRVIARRVFLDKLGAADLAGRGTIDARLELRGGRIESGSWTASARELALHGAQGPRFDHASVSGRLSRDAGDVLLDFSDLQLTRGARLERAPALSARLAFAADSLRVAQATVQAERLPFMAAELLAAAAAPWLPQPVLAAPAGWLPTAGELHGLHFDAGRRGRSPQDWELSARISGAELTRGSDHARLTQLAARLRSDERGSALLFDEGATLAVQTAQEREPRMLEIRGTIAQSIAGSPAWKFDGLALAAGDSRISVDGDWNVGQPHKVPLRVALAHVERQLLQDAWNLLAGEAAAPQPWSELESGQILEGKLQLEPQADGAVNWPRSRGTLVVANLATTGQDAPRLSAAQGALAFANGGVQLKLQAGRIDDLAVTAARMDWPRGGVPRMRASLTGDLQSPLLRSVLADQGLERMTGSVTIEAEARGERELRRPQSWRVNARLSDAALRLGAGLPPLAALSGTLRYSAEALRGVSLQGQWLGGRVQIESRRAARGALVYSLDGVADAAPLLKLLGGAEAAQRVSGRLAWSGSAQLEDAAALWRVTLSSNLYGVESRLTQPFDKSRTRALPLSATLGIAADGIREFSVEGGPQLIVRGQVRGGSTLAHFEVQGVAGELRSGANAAAEPALKFEALDIRRAPALLAAAGSVLPADGELTLTIGDLRIADRSLGLLHASIARRDQDLDFSLESAAAALHQLAAHGRCGNDGRCRAEFSADTPQLADLLRGANLPSEWPATRLHAAGALDWPVDPAADFAHSLAGSFDLETWGVSSDHQLSARATLADGQILLADVQGTGPESDQVFRGNGRIGLLARDYDLTVDYDRVALAATAVPSSARARLARAWNTLRGSAASHGWTEPSESSRVQWHGSWDPER